MGLNSEVRATLVQAVHRNQKANGLQSALDVGSAVLDGWFGGDLDAWRSGQGDVTLRALSRDPAIGLSSSTLYRYVAITALCRRLGRTRFEHLGTSHLRQVLPLPIEEQIVLVNRAEAGEWTVQQLIHEIRNRPVLEDPNDCDAHERLRSWSRRWKRLSRLGDSDELPLESTKSLLRLVQGALEDLRGIEHELLEASRRRR